MQIKGDKPDFEYRFQMGTRSRGITDWDAELKRVSLNIAAAEKTIEHQRKRVDKLSSGGCATSDAKRQLEMMLTVLGMMKHYKSSIEWHLSDGSVH